MITDPRFAPKRDDLPWLRRRRVPRSVASRPVADAHEAIAEFVTGHASGHHHDPVRAAPSSAAASSAASSSAASSSAAPSSAAASSPASLDLDEASTHDAVADFVTGHGTGHHHPPAPAQSAPSTSSLDLDEPPPSAPRPSAPSASPSLDLDERPPPPARPPSSASLDLDEPAPQPSRPVRQAPRAPVGRRRVDVRVRVGNRVILTVSDPTVTLTRLQSGIGALTIEAACSDEVGDLRIGCAYELASGATSTVQLTQGNRLAPPGSRRPILVASHERFETIGVDLRQCTDIRRLVVYAFSESRSALNWGGTLITTTLGGARVELPLEALQSGDAAILQSIYNVRGEFVLRAEMLTVFGGVREACRSYGFDKITWLDDRTPVD